MYVVKYLKMMNKIKAKAYLAIIIVTVYVLNPSTD